MGALYYFRPSLHTRPSKQPEVELSADVERYFIHPKVLRHSPVETVVKFEVLAAYRQTLSRTHIFRLPYRATTLPHSERLGAVSCEVSPDDKMVEVSIPNPERLAFRKIHFFIGH